MNQEFGFETIPLEIAEFEDQQFEREGEWGRRSFTAGGSRYSRPQPGPGLRPHASKPGPILRPRPFPNGPRRPLAVVHEPYGLVSEPYPGEPEPPGSEPMRWVQDCLNQAMGLQLPVTGFMGPKTRSAVRSFQKQQGLRASGIVGPDTEEALKAACEKRGGRPSSEEMEFGEISESGRSKGLLRGWPEHDLVAENFDFELGSSAYPGISCVTPGNPYVLHCFPPFVSELTKEHHDHLDIIAEKIRRSFSTSRPITKVNIVGHSATWHDQSSSDRERNARDRANNAREELIRRLYQIGLAKRVNVETDGRSDAVRWLGRPYSSTSGDQQAQNDRALNRRVEIRLIESEKNGEPKPPEVIPPKVPSIEPRMMREHEFTKLERSFARKAWKRAVKYVFYARWFMQHLESLDEKTRIGLWNGKISFPGNYGWGIPKVWFGEYNGMRFANVRDAVNRIWEKFRESPWTMKRQDCIVWASAHVIVYPQIRLCDNFFGKMSDEDLNNATRILIHEMGHHIWIESPRRQLTDRHVAPIPPCNGPCYGIGKSQMLAKKFAKHAVANPDNYAYFVQSYGSHLP